MRNCFFTVPYVDVHQIVFWDVGSGNQAFALDIPAVGIADAAFSPDGKLFAAVTYASDNRILFWTLPR
jgi:WD40 repeat protein